MWVRPAAPGIGWPPLLSLIAVLTVRVLPAYCSRSMQGPCLSGTDTSNQCNVTHVDITLGGIFPLYRYDPKLGICSTSGDLGFGIQLVEAMRHAVLMVNRNESLLPNVTLGYDIRDSCRSGTQAVRECLNFLNRDSGACESPDNRTDASEHGLSRVVGIVGSYASTVSISMSHLLGLFKIPLISYGSTSPQLSSAKLYPYFLRTIPSDDLVGDAIATMIQEMSWTFVGFVFSDDSYGRGSVATTKHSMGLQEGGSFCSSSKGESCNRTSRCVAFERTVPDTAKCGDVIFADIWQDLLFNEPQRHASVVVVILHGEEAACFFNFPRDSGNTTIYSQALEKNATFIGSDSWGGKIQLVRVSMNLTRGAVSPLPAAEPYEPFKEHWTKLDRERNGNNPWLEAVFANTTKYQREGYQMSVYVPYVYHAVFAFAHALHKLYVHCDFNVTCLKRAASKGENMLQELLAVNFTTIYGEQFRFAPNGDPFFTEHDIKNVQDGGARGGKEVEFVTVGQYSSALIPDEKNMTASVSRRIAEGRDLRSQNRSKKIELSMSSVVWNQGTSRPPQSQCSPDCRPGYYRPRHLYSSFTCCWQCVQCQQHSTSAETNSDTCQKCDATTVSNANGTLCQSLPEIQLALPDVYAFVLLLLASVGLVVCLVCFIQCLCKWSCYFHLTIASTTACLLAMCSIYASVLLQIFGPSSIRCAIRSFLSNIGMATLASFILVYVLYRLAVLYRTRLSLLFYEPAHRCVVGVIFLAGDVMILLLYVMSGDSPSVQEKIKDHLQMTRLCGFHSVDVFSGIYVIVLNACTMLLSFVALCLEKGRRSGVYALDLNSSMLTMIGSASALSALLLGLTLALQTTVTPLIKDLLLHLSAWLFATSYLLLVFLQPIRKLAPLTEEERVWLDDLRSNLSLLGRQRSSRSSLDRAELRTCSRMSMTPFPSQTSQSVGSVGDSLDRVETPDTNGSLIDITTGCKPSTSYWNDSNCVIPFQTQDDVVIPLRHLAQVDGEERQPEGLSVLAEASVLDRHESTLADEERGSGDVYLFNFADNEDSDSGVAAMCDESDDPRDQ